MDRFISSKLYKLDPRAQAIKYRASNNTNRSDASHFHRDVINYSTFIPEIYTVLFYLDEADMKIIPESHKTPRMNIIKGLLSKTITLKMKPGDVLIFNSCTLHRGKFSINMTGNRRLIQVFDTTFGHNYTNDILHLPCIGECRKYNFNNISVYLSQIPLLRNLNKITFVNTCTGYGKNPTKYRMISQEAGSLRYTESKGNIQKANLYRIMDSNLRDPRESDWYKIHHEIHVKTVLNLIILLLCLIFLVYLI